MVEIPITSPPSATPRDGEPSPKEGVAISALIHIDSINF